MLSPGTRVAEPGRATRAKEAIVRTGPDPRQGLVALLALALLLLATSAFAQPLGLSFGGFQDDHAEAAVPSGDGGQVVVGWTESFQAGGCDIWVVRPGENGYPQWQKTFGGPGRDEVARQRNGPRAGLRRDRGIQVSGKAEPGADLSRVEGDVAARGVDPEGPVDLGRGCTRHDQTAGKYQCDAPRFRTRCVSHATVLFAECLFAFSRRELR